MLRRLSDWDRKLVAFVAETRSAPYELGAQDCAAWALRAIDVQCGTHHADALRGAYADFDGARRYLASRGWATAADACLELCGAPLRRVHYAQRGDVLHRPDADDPGVLLVVLGDVVASPGPFGLLFTSFRVALTGTMVAYPVGR